MGWDGEHGMRECGRGRAQRSRLGNKVNEGEQRGEGERGTPAGCAAETGLQPPGQRGCFSACSALSPGKTGNGKSIRHVGKKEGGPPPSTQPRPRASAWICPQLGTGWRPRGSGPDVPRRDAVQRGV